MPGYDLRRAYVILGLSPPVTKDDLAAHYKALVKRWHPDRYQADPAGQAEATLRLRNINIAYEIVAASLENVSDLQESTYSTDPSDSAVPNLPDPRWPSDPTAKPFSLSPEQIDEIVESINRMNRVLPEMSIHRWLSVAAMLGCFITSMMLARDHRGVSTGAGIVFTPLVSSFLGVRLIWRADEYPTGAVLRLLCRFGGWLVLAAPTIVVLTLLATSA